MNPVVKPTCKHISSLLTGHRRPAAWAGALVLVLLALLPRMASAQLTLPWFEPFAYAENENLGASGLSGTNWTTGNSSGASSARILAGAALTYVGLAADTNSPARGIRSTGSGKNRGALFTPQNSGTVYASFLLNVLTNPLLPRVIFNLSGSTGTGPNGNATVWLDAQGQLWLGKVNSATWTYTAGPTFPLVHTNTYLVVVAYKFIDGTANDEVDLWLNPIPLGNAASIPTPTLVITNGSDATSLQSVYYMAPSSQGTALFYMDDLRVAVNDWAFVTPSTCSPGTAYSVTGGGVVCGSTTVSVGLSGSETGVDYWLVTNGAPAGIVVPGTGSAISFGSQSSDGVYTAFASNTVTACTGWMSGSATVANGCPPEIVVQPKALTVPTGCTCTFSVTATGANLAYQWRRNGVNLTNDVHYSGATSPNLTLSTVSSSDVATSTDGYDVVVTGKVGSPATSTRVALSLGTARNLTWVGDGVTDLWDILTTADWALPGGTASTFNFGDNVTFDDTATSYTINLGSGFLSPSTVKVIAGTYAFGGSGSIIGTNTTLVVSNTAALTMNLTNRYGGGTFIQSNATVNLQYPGSLGTGPVILDGGTLNITAPSKTLTYYGDLQVRADSIISGVSGATPNLYGKLVGTAGSLTFNGASSSSYLSPNFYANFTFGLPITGNNTTFAFYGDTTGQQVFNGPISGPCNVQRRGSGTCLLNVPSTYSGQTLLNGGGLGFGCDSVSTNSPLPNMDASPVGLGSFTLDDTATAGSQWVFASGGPRVVGNAIQTSTGTNNFTFVIGGTNALELAGSINMGTGILTVQATNTALTTLSGGISAGSGLTKTGSGTLVLRGDLYYTGPTTVSAGRLLIDGPLYDSSSTVTATAGTLGGSGTLYGPAVVQSGASLSPGQTGLGTLTINNSLTLQAGSTNVFQLNKSLGTNGLVQGLTSVTYGGTLVVSNLAGTLAINDSFKLFDAASYAGAFSAILPGPGAGLAWSNSLAIDGTLRIVKGGPATNRTNLTYAITAQGLNLSWPADHIGWVLQAQTNALTIGLSTNWVTVPGSTATNQVTLPTGTAPTSVFFRLLLTQ